MSLTANSIVGSLVAEDYKTASVFKQFGIDFCCNGHRSIADACSAAGADETAVLDALKNVAKSNNNAQTDYNHWPLDLLADYIEKKHHRYVRTTIETLTPFLQKIANVHGDRHPELLEAEQLFQESADELMMHMHKEEKILFPYIRQMVANNGQAGTPGFGSIQNPIRVMMHEHDNEGERFRKIAALTQNYQPPADACNTYTVTLAMLKEFEEDLHLHIHLENNILFPKSIAMEQGE